MLLGSGSACWNNNPRLISGLWSGCNILTKSCNHIFSVVVSHDLTITFCRRGFMAHDSDMTYLPACFGPLVFFDDESAYCRYQDRLNSRSVCCRMSAPTIPKTGSQCKSGWLHLGSSSLRVSSSFQRRNHVSLSIRRPLLSAEARKVDAFGYVIKETRY